MMTDDAMILYVVNVEYKLSGILSCVCGRVVLYCMLYCVCSIVYMKFVLLKIV